MVRYEPRSLQAVHPGLARHVTVRETAPFRRLTGRGGCVASRRNLGMTSPMAQPFPDPGRSVVLYALYV